MSRSLGEKRILIVEDEYFIAQDMARAFRALGARVFGPVATAEAAMDLVREQDVDVAVLDIHLRGGTVYPLADLLLSQGVPFLFATGSDPATVPQRYARIRLCEKPVEPASVAQMLAELAPETERAGENLAYVIRKEGARWRWFVHRDGRRVDQGSAGSSISARVAAFAAAMSRFR